MDEHAFAVVHKDVMSPRWGTYLLVLLLVVYLLIGVSYVFQTPLWQVPDEPAHVNYVLHVARTGTLPVLQSGDYDAAYLEQIKAARFPPNMSVENIRYEGHQPPLYYIVGAAVVRTIVPQVLGDHPSQEVLARAVHALRLLSLLLSIGILYCTFLIARTLFPRQPTLAVAATALVAFIPQHVAMMSGANNDVMGELALALLLLQLVRDIQGPNQRTREWLRRGILMGFVLLAKTTVYVPAFLALAAFHLLRATEVHPRSPLRKEIVEGIVEVLIGLLLALPFFMHNVNAYGWPDVLGWRRHAAIVVGQTTTAQYIAEHGWGAYMQRAVTWTFRSFWGQFGWMGVLMDARIYKVLAYFTALLFIAIAVFLLHGCRPRLERLFLRRKTTSPECLAEYQHNGLGVLSAAAVGTWIAYLGYNVSFLQHQGRYLFTGLIPLAVIAIPGIWILLDPRKARRAMTIVAVLGWVALGLAVMNVAGFDRWDALALFGLAFWFGFAEKFPRWRPAWMLLPFVGLAVLDMEALYRFILPALGRT